MSKVLISASYPTHTSIFMPRARLICMASKKTKEKWENFRFNHQYRCNKKRKYYRIFLSHIPVFLVWNTSPEKLKLVIDLGKFKHGTEKHLQCQQKNTETIYLFIYFILYTYSLGFANHLFHNLEFLLPL